MSFATSAMYGTTLPVKEIPESGISYFCKKMFKSEKKEKKIISLLTTIQFLRLEAATTVRSKNL